ncbi:hypothetical protein SAMN05421743_12222 [Thalassobacillus cyri]|uniref:YkoS n=1 Tax=Thalassobacillus cyri TaxID=571932 RepID=A0A1H4H3S1_9BACI|nr:DUF6044 family protein [Thalassobacillus cyri]SEB16455.1 hypothetical protein SAMN05421743_12222 [Thalassobacillus cyri]
MWYTIFERFIRHKLLFVACLILAAYLLPYYILGEDTHIRVHDNLDSNIVWYKLVVENNLIFASPNEMLQSIINGLPRSALPSGLDAMVWLYALFEPFTAYTINQTIMRVVGLFGMYFLLAYIFEKRKDTWTNFQLPIAGAALTFALLPYWPSGALSMAGMPLALLAFLKIRELGRQAKKRYWIFLVLIPFHSNFILAFSFFISIIGVIWLVDWIRFKKFNWPFFSSIVLMTSIFLIKNYMIIYSMFLDSAFVPHREEFTLGDKDAVGAFQLGIENFLFAHTHDETFHYRFILPGAMAAILIAVWKRAAVPKLLLSLLAANLILSIWYGYWYWEGWRVPKDTISLLNNFNFSRYHFLHPLLWYLVFGLAMRIIQKRVFLGKFIVLLLILGQIAILFPLAEEFKYREFDSFTYKEFYSEALFDDIKEYIGEDPSDYRVVSIGMHPTIAQYNGMWTLDTYNTTIPLSYKHKWREVIAPELEKNDTLRHYFDTWGSRLYLYVDELGKNYDFTKNSNKKIENLDINTDQLESMGGDYILSAVPIENYEANNLVFERVFESEASPWSIHLYKIDE